MVTPPILTDSKPIDRQVIPARQPKKPIVQRMKMILLRTLPSFARVWMVSSVFVFMFCFLSLSQLIVPQTSIAHKD